MCVCVCVCNCAVHLKPTQHRKSIIDVQSLTHGHLFETPWIATHQASLSFTISWLLLLLLLLLLLSRFSRV